MAILLDMDELAIEDRRYISSKRAAQLTGYAKDYIGQLCREGRVPARLVGRNWYVLESAIQDHRFGPLVKSEERKTEKNAETPIAAGEEKSWPAQRYEQATEEILPTIMRQPASAPDSDLHAKLQDAWQEWLAKASSSALDQKKQSESEVNKPSEEQQASEEHPLPQANALIAEPVASESQDPAENDQGERVPIHTLYSTLSEVDPSVPISLHRIAQDGNIAPARKAEPDLVPLAQRTHTKRRSPGRWRALRLASVFVALIFMAVAVLGSGYFDKYIVLVRQASLIAGFSVYNK